MSIISQFLVASSKDKTQTFTSSGTFTVPDNVFTLFVTMCGAGGGVYRTNYSNYVYGGAGAGGTYINYPISVTPGDVLTITIGAGGKSMLWTGSNTYGAYPTNGGSSKISIGATDLLIAYGGSISGNTNNPATGNFTGGCGGYPNGSGGGGQAAGGGGCGLAKGSSVIGGGHVSNPGDGTWENYWGMGPTKGISNNSAQSFIPGYGGGEFMSGAQPSEYTAGTVIGEPGIITLKWIGA